VGDQTTRSARLRVLLITVVALAAFGAFLWVRGKRGGFANDTIGFRKIDRANSSDLQTPQLASGPSVSPALSPVPPVGSAISTTAQTPGPLNAEGTPPPLENNQAAAKDALTGSFVGTLKLIIPVAGVRPDQLLDTFTDARSEGRVHDAIDIPAPAGTPVVAAADGEIIKLFQSERGGTTIYQLSPDKKLVFYYAHLQRYADGLAVGKFVKQGEIIAYVGDTGNAGVGNFHLHFSISVVADPKRYWEGTNINPYPLLRK
jgi:murein DD-endopeptidase MepM/ murein hydrolase activator NlpD